jgi:hypothetical protein
MRRVDTPNVCGFDACAIGEPGHVPGQSLEKLSYAAYSSVSARNIRATHTSLQPKRRGHDVQSLRIFSG